MAKGKGGNQDKNKRDSDGMSKQHYTDTSDCEYCSNNMQCPYWWQDPEDGVWYHNQSGSRQYINDAVIEEQFGVIDKTPEPPTQYPRRKRGLW
ncbi:hypothetical protein [Dictyobacter kobayashii]|uniref:Uncharacterized protein n=1 Tax=Dictyobacter kobayashii TaxID=2014872 RepID=A0A402AIL8_9CHLR|nr:hypothetical protein [Dictyobacter kobayashii]GCE18971.1 hypothetical protein KDK_27710 [Dictyobacter kobayashii]